MHELKVIFSSSFLIVFPPKSTLSDFIFCLLIGFLTNLFISSFLLFIQFKSFCTLSSWTNPCKHICIDNEILDLNNKRPFEFLESVSVVAFSQVKSVACPVTQYKATFTRHTIALYCYWLIPHRSSDDTYLLLPILLLAAACSSFRANARSLRKFNRTIPKHWLDLIWELIYENLHHGC